MRALIRGKEVISEPFSPWIQNNLKWLTGKEKDVDGNPLPGDGWTLVEDYQEPAARQSEGRGHDSAHVPVESHEEPEPIQSTPSAARQSEGAGYDSTRVSAVQDAETLPETVTIGGVKYARTT